MRVMRSNLDGSQIETLIEAGRGDTDRRDQTRCPSHPDRCVIDRQRDLRRRRRAAPAFADPTERSAPGPSAKELIALRAGRAISGSENMRVLVDALRRRSNNGVQS